jgi:hypothetical protein
MSNGGVCTGGKGEEEEYDSADTDELLASNKPPPSSLQENARKRSLPLASGRDQKRRSLPLFQSPSSDEEDEEDKDNTDALKPSDPKADMSQQSQTTISRLKPSPVEDRNGEVEAENDEEDEVEDDDGDYDDEPKTSVLGSLLSSPTMCVRTSGEHDVCSHQSGTSQFVFDFLGALSTGGDQKASGRDWIDLQPIRAKQRVT